MNIKNLWDVSKAVLGGQFIALNIYIGGESKINRLSFHLMKLGGKKEKKIKLKICRKKEEKKSMKQTKFNVI